MAIDAYLKDRLVSLHKELVAAESDVDMRRAQGKVLEIQQLMKALSDPL